VDATGPYSLDGSTEKFLFFAHHKELLDAAQAVMVKRKVEFIRIDGSTATSARGGLVNAFQAGSNRYK